MNVKVKSRLIFTFTPDLSYVTSIIFARVKITRQWKSTLTPQHGGFVPRLNNREFKQQRRRRGRLRKRHLKSEFPPPQTLSRLFHLI